ncbi:MAG TPA: hypothetical protein VGL58_03360 [Caulobacteraceae bacterium]|jgi:hypothetical protein
MVSADNRVRLKVLAAVAVSYLIGFGPLLLAGWAGLWWAKILLTLSWPLAVLAGAVSAVFASWVARRPLVWALAALITATALSVIALYIPTRSWAGSASLFVAVPAAIAFYVIARIWLRPDLRAPNP